MQKCANLCPLPPKPPLTGQIVHSSTPWPSARVLHTCHSTLVIAQEPILPCTMYECAACKGTCLVQDTLHCPLWWLLKLISNWAPKSIKLESKKNSPIHPCHPVLFKSPTISFNYNNGIFLPLRPGLLQHYYAWILSPKDSATTKFPFPECGQTYQIGST